MYSWLTCVTDQQELAMVEWSGMTYGCVKESRLSRRAMKHNQPSEEAPDFYETKSCSVCTTVCRISSGTALWKRKGWLFQQGQILSAFLWFATKHKAHVTSGGATLMYYTGLWAARILNSETGSAGHETWHHAEITHSRAKRTHTLQHQRKQREIWRTTTAACWRMCFSFLCDEYEADSQCIRPL